MAQQPRPTWFPKHGSRIVRAVILSLLALCVATGAAISDVYLHRGIESGTERPFVVQPTGRELATNVDLTLFAPSQTDDIVKVLQTNGFTFVRQPFAWSDIELSKGQFVWDRYDQIVDKLTSRGIKVIAVIAKTPSWAREPSQIGYVDAPPVDANDYAAFVSEFVAHYVGKVEFIQLGDLPNQPQRWGGVPATPAAYAKLLSAGFNAARSAFSETKVLTAELDPVGPDGLVGDDVDFLVGLYEAGAAPFFDIVSVAIDGGASSPYDRQVSVSRTNLSRATIVRELMIDNGDQAKPVWLTHYGWKSGSEERGITEEERADYLVAGMKRARAEWPWMGLMVAWGLLPIDAERDTGYTLLDATGAGTPSFSALTEFGNSGIAGIAATGYVPMDSSPVNYRGAWADQHLLRQTFKTTSEVGATMTLRFRGTGLTAILRQSGQAGLVHVTIDGKPLPGWLQVDGASVVDLDFYLARDVPITLASGLTEGDHELVMKLAEPGVLTIGGLIVSRDPPLLWPVILLLVIAAGLLFVALRDVVYVVARMSGYLQERDGLELRPPLPRMPNWRPATRYR